MISPYEAGAAYRIRFVEHDQTLLAIVAAVFDHELVLTDVRVSPDGPVCYERLVVGRAAVREAWQVAAAPPAPRRVTVEG